MEGDLGVIPIDRRRFLRIASGLVLLGSSALLLARRLFPSRLTEGERVALDALLDTLIPADEFSPSATEAGVGASIRAAATGDASYQYLLKQGCSRLEDQATERFGRPFAALLEAQRAAIVEELAGAPEGSESRAFFHRVWLDSCYHYYALPESWAGLAYAGPPQPLGFDDYQSPPQPWPVTMR